MKQKFLLVLAVFGMITAAFSTGSVRLSDMDDEIPAVVKDSFSTRFPGIKAKWEKEGNYFEACFEKDDKDMSATFSAMGNLLETEMEIPVSELPAKVSEYVKNNYKKQIREASRITDAKGIVTYEAEVGKKDIIFDAQGNFLRESAN